MSSLLKLNKLPFQRAVEREHIDLTVGRSTGVPKILKAMAANGSPAPVFETDDDRTAYLIRLPAHPLAAAPEAPSAQVTEQVTGEVTGEVGKGSRLHGRA